MGDFDDLIPEFIAESTDLLQTMESGLLDLERGSVDEGVIHTIFRAIHSIKGGAGFVGLDKIERLGHRMEDLLNLIRNHDLEATQPVTDALLQSLDVLTLLFQQVSDDSAIDIDGPIRGLEAALNAGVTEEVRQDVEQIAPGTDQAGLPNFEVSEYNLRAKLKAGTVYCVHLNLSQIEDRGLTPIQLINEMLSMGEILDSLVNLPDSEDPEQAETFDPSFDVLYSTVLEPDLLAAAMRLEDGEFREVTAADFNLDQPATPEAPQAPPAPAPAPPAPDPAPPQPAPEQAAPAPAPAQPAPAPAQPTAQVQAAVSQAPAAVAAALSEAAKTEDAEDLRHGGEYLTFSLGKEIYGVDVMSVQEIIGIPHLSKLPRSPEYVLGVMNLRGMVVPVVDLRLKLGLSLPEDGDPVAVVMHVGEKVMGAVVDGVRDVLEVAEKNIQVPPEFAGHVRREYLRGLSRREGEMLILLEMDKLLAPDTMTDGV